jgi:hypothetical protein
MFDLLFILQFKKDQYKFLLNLFYYFTNILNHYHIFNLHNLAVADVVRTSLGPRGMDKMVSNPYNLEFISNYKFIE